ncbi:VOC family protein [Methylovirgula sp. 4M-Z18]|uniref:VOC family protein n=1 Tax=Methylovirgula sp. 4M-Z18 TaxID=2293567 RepID=UPI000E2E6DDF|nr:VOC family protein [Methylovirgula sp. 4M-Z18]RFB80548.1 VOC family protein [Methylovirgula sp. 4M-Z18]
MPRALDHLVLASRTLTAQADLYRRMGFTVGVKNRHPWGTENQIVQLHGAFLELISTGDGYRPPQDIDLHTFSFSAFIAHFIENREGFAMLVLQSQDAETDRAKFKQAGIGDFETFHFGRKAKRPDGSDTEVAFTLAFAQSKHIDEAGFFVCQQHFPQNFWNPAFQTHANTAQAIAGVILVAEQPGAHLSFLNAFAGTSADAAPIDTGGGQIAVLSPAEFAQNYGASESQPRTSPWLAAYRIAVSDLAQCASSLADGKVVFSESNGWLIVPPLVAFGVTIVFETVVGADKK